MATRKKIGVSDHALVRWLERVCEIDMTCFREAILSVVQEAHSCGAYTVSKDGFTYLIEDDTVVSVVPKRLQAGTNRFFRERESA